MFWDRFRRTPEPLVHAEWADDLASVERVVGRAPRGAALDPMVVAALDPDQGGDAAGLVNADDIVGGPRQLEVLRIGGYHPVDDVDLFDGLADRLVVERLETRVSAVGPQAVEVGKLREVHAGTRKTSSTFSGCTRVTSPN